MKTAVANGTQARRAKTRPGFRLVAGALPLPLLVLSLAGASTATAAGVDSLDARREVSMCSSLRKDAAITACRRALKLGLSPQRAATVQLLLALNLSGLNRWQEAADAYRERLRLRPDDAEAHWRLGDALLFGLSQPAEALVPLREAVRLKPDMAGAQGSLGIALAASGAYPEAVTALEEAVRIEPEYFTNRPAAKRVYEAARRGERWGR
jgi:tetratricopeptide (TPR) repeat protein